MGKVGVIGDSRARHNNEIKDKINDKVGKKGRNLSKSKKTESGFLIFGDRITFIKLRQMFIITPILHHFNPERYI